MATEYTVWTAENVGITKELRGSIVPKSQLKRGLPGLIDWILTKHGRAHQRTLAARAARAKNSSRQVHRDARELQIAEKSNKEDSR